MRWLFRETVEKAGHRVFPSSVSLPTAYGNEPSRNQGRKRERKEKKPKCNFIAQRKK